MKGKRYTANVRTTPKGDKTRLYSAIRNQVVYSPISSLAIGQAAGQQRLAYNAAVEYTLAHPNVSKFDLHKQLTSWRKTKPEKWRGHLRIHRPGLEQGRDTVRKYDAATKRTLNECEKEVRLRKSKAKPTRRRMPKHPVRPGRNLDTTKLYKSRKAPITLTVYDANLIKLRAPRTITAAGVTVNLRDPVPDDTQVKAVTITERKNSRSKGRNRPLHKRSYRIVLIISLPDPDQKVPWDNPTGGDVGVANIITFADYRPAHQPDTSTREQIKAVRHNQKRLKPGGRAWKKLQKKARKLHRQHSNKLDNWEHHLAKNIAQEHSLVAVEDLKLQNMTRSAKGTPENPGKKVIQKTGTNRSMAQARPGALLKKIERQCEKNGTWFTRVPPQWTSKTCPLCECRAPENRKSQPEFQCIGCNLRAHADAVAATNCRILGIRALTVMLLLWAYGPDKQAASIRRRQGLPPLADSLTLIAGRSGPKLGPSSKRKAAPQGAAKAHAS